MKLLGIDPGLAKMGICVAEYDGKTLEVQEMYCFETKKNQRKVLDSEDNVKRLDKLDMLLGGFGNCDIICAEYMSFPPSASAAAKLASTWGLIVAFKNQWDMPLVLVSPQDIKLAVCDSNKASKAAMEVRLMDKYPNIVGLLGGIAATKQEHPIDALGAIVAALDSDIVKAGLRR